MGYQKLVVSKRHKNYSYQLQKKAFLFKPEENFFLFNFFMSGRQIKFVNSIKYMGVLLDGKLTFVQHVNFVWLKVLELKEFYINYQ